MTFTEALTKVIAPLWPILAALAAFAGAAIVTISRREVSRKLFNDDGTTKYVTSVDFDEFKDVVAVNLGEFKTEVAKEFAKHKREVEQMCAVNQRACNQGVVLRIEGVLEKLESMDHERAEAKKESMAEIKEHTKQMTKMSNCISRLTGKFEQMEKQLSNKVGNA